MSSEKEREALGEREEKVALKDDEEKQNDQGFEEEPELDSSKVKFINGGAQAAGPEAHVDIEGHTKVIAIVLIFITCFVTLCSVTFSVANLSYELDRSTLIF